MPDTGKRKRLNLLLTLLLVAGIAFAPALSSGDETGEYEIKAGFLYKFLLFADWPKEAFLKTNGDIVLCILGDQPAPQTFAPVTGDRIHERKLKILRIPSAADARSFSRCHLLFIGASQQQNIGRIIKSLQDAPVLTVGETRGFVDQGGMINFIVRDEFVGFEINPKAAEEAGIKIRAQLLRVAERIVNGKHD